MEDWTSDIPGLYLSNRGKEYTYGSWGKHTASMDMIFSKCPFKHSKPMINFG